MMFNFKDIQSTNPEIEVQDIMGYKADCMTPNEKCQNNATKRIIHTTNIFELCPTCFDEMTSVSTK